LVEYNKQHHELDEERQLKDLREQYDEMMIQREEQQEQLDLHRGKNSLLKEDERNVDATITRANDEIKDSNERIAIARDEKDKADASL